jgi:hypothetical protein
MRLVRVKRLTILEQANARFLPQLADDYRVNTGLVIGQSSRE